MKTSSPGHDRSTSPAAQSVRCAPAGATGRSAARVSTAVVAAAFSALAALATPGAAAADASGMAAAAAQVPTPEMDRGFLKLGFDRLSSYKFVTPEFDPTANPKAVQPSGEEQIPAAVKGWSGKKAMITGFMLPTKISNGQTTEFLLMANQMACCFGTVPNMNDWVIVHIPSGTPIIQDVPISFRGTFKVGAMFESGYMTGIYELDADGPGEVKP